MNAILFLRNLAGSLIARRIEERAACRAARRGARPESVLLLAVLLLGLPLQPAGAQEDSPPDDAGAAPVDFRVDILPVLQRNCLACHSESTGEAGVVLESAAGIRDGRDSSDEPLVVPGDAASSRLYQIAAHETEPIMPPEGNDVGAKPLDPAQLALLRRWIDGGAKDGTVSGDADIAWQALPNQIHPVYCVAVTPNGRWAVAGRGNEVEVFDLLRGASAGRLVDRAIASQLGQDASAAAHLDLVQSVAVRPDGRMIASGGFRTVKIWTRRDPLPQAWPAASDSPITALAVGDGDRVAVGRQDGTVQLYDGSESPTAQPNAVRAPDGHAIVRLRLEGDQLLILPAELPPQRWTSAEGLAGLPVDAPLVDIVPLPGGHLIGVDQQDRLRGWKRSEQGAWEPWPETLPETPVKNVGLLADGRLAAAAADGQLLVIDGATGAVQKQVGLKAAADQLAVSPSGKQLALCDGDGHASFWDLEREPLALTGDFGALVRLRQAELQAQLADRQLANAQSDLKQAKSRHDEEVKSRDETAKQVEASKEELSKRTAALEAARKELADADGRLKALQQTLADLDAQSMALDEQLSGAASAVEARQEEVKHSTADVEQSRMKRDRTDEILTAAREILSADPERDLVAVVQLTAGQLKTQFGQELQAAEQELQARQAALAAAQKQHAELTSAKQELTAQLEAQKKELDPLKKATNEKRQAADRAQQEVDEATRAAELAADALERSQQRVAELEAQLPAWEQAVSQADEAAQAAKANQASQKEEVDGLQFAVRQTAVLDDGVCVVVDEHGTVRLFRGSDGQPIETLDVWDAQPGPVALLPGERLLVASGPTLFVLPLTPQWELSAVWGNPASTRPFADRITALDFSPDGRLLAIGGGQPSRSGQVQIWDVQQGRMVHEFDQPHSDTVLAVRFSPDGRYLATAGADRFLRVFDVASHEPVGTFEGHTHHVLSVDWQLDGRRLVTGSADQTVKLWDFREKRQIRTIEGFGKDVTAVRFIGASDEFYAACADQSVARCNVEGKRQVIGRTQAYLYCLAVPAAGDRLVTGSHSGAVEVLDGKGETVARFTSTR